MNDPDIWKMQKDPIFGPVMKRAWELYSRKGADYTGGGDRFTNFVEGARKAGLSVYQVWNVYKAKHEAAIDTFCAKGQVESEPIETRVLDVIVYHILLWGMIQRWGKK